MKKNKKGFRIIGFLLVVLMLTTALSGIPGFINVVLAEDAKDLADVGTTISEDGLYVAGSNVTTPIVIESGVTADLTIDSVTIEATDSPAIWVEAGATLNLTINGTNTLTGGPGYAGIAVDPGYDNDWDYLEEKSAILNISGSKSSVLTVNGGSASNTYGAGAGIGGNGVNRPGAEDGVDFGFINIRDSFNGEINANGGDNIEERDVYGAGAGIGSGGNNTPIVGNDDEGGPIYATWPPFGTITIENGTINATGGDNTANSEAGGAGIGSGGQRNDGKTPFSYININILGGTINAIGGPLGAGIGGGSNCDGGNIKISGGTVYAKGTSSGSFSGTGIGGGDNAGFTSIEISGGYVIADARNGGAAGIGMGTNAQFGINPDVQPNISISGKNTYVMAIGGTYAGSRRTYGGAGIGSGYVGRPQSFGEGDLNTIITIEEGATVYSYGGYRSQAIGYGYKDGLGPSEDESKYYYNGEGIELELDDSITLWAVNYDYYLPALPAYREASNLPIKVGHLKYVSTERYLTTYTYSGEDKDTKTGEKLIGESPEEQAVGSLTAPDLFAEQYPVDAYIKWELKGDQMHFVFTPEVTNMTDLFYPFAGENNEYRIGGSDLHGNWATLAPAIILVDYEFVGEFPKGVTTPDEEYIAKNSKYEEKEQNPDIYDDEDYYWEFDGWYLDDDCTQKFPTEGKELSENTTLYGKWTKKDKIKVSYEWVTEGPSDVEPPALEKIIPGSKYTSTPQDDTQDENWIFEGWFTDEDCTIPYVEGTVLEEDTILYGKWSREKIKVDYEFVGESPEGVNPPEGEELEKGTSYNATKQDTSDAEEWIFDGWYYDEDCTIEFKDGDILNKNTTLYGKWTKKENPTPEKEEIEVNYEWVGDSYPDDVTKPDSETIKKGTSYNSVQQTPSADEDWIFDGWYLDENCTEKYEDGTILEKNTTLYGKWTKVPEEPTPDKPQPEEPTPDKPQPEEPTPEKPSEPKPTPNVPETPSVDEETPNTSDSIYSTILMNILSLGGITGLLINSKKRLFKTE